MGADLLRRAGQRLQVREGARILEAPELAVAHAALRPLAPENEVLVSRFFMLC